MNFAVNASGWVRDYTGAWHPPGHAFPVYIHGTLHLYAPSGWAGVRFALTVLWLAIRGKRAPIEAPYEHTFTMYATLATEPT